MAKVGCPECGNANAEIRYEATVSEDGTWERVDLFKSTGVPKNTDAHDDSHPIYICSGCDHEYTEPKVVEE